MQVRVVKVTETATVGRYQLKLSCGHEKYVTRPRRPVRKVTACGICALDAGPRAGALEIERREREGLR